MASRLSKKTWIIIVVTLIIAVGAIVGIALGRNSSSPTDITLPIITWDETTLSELAGTPVVLNFWLHGVPVAAQSYPILSL
jgi:flagellar basal body-associated protein FliL